MAAHNLRQNTAASRPVWSIGLLAFISKQIDDSIDSIAQRQLFVAMLAILCVHVGGIGLLVTGAAAAWPVAVGLF